jgi:hypothetical protein
MRRLGTGIVALALSLSVGGAATAQEPLSAGAHEGSGRPGDALTVFGAGWPAEDRVTVSFCGNQALNGSIDCNLPGSRSVITNPDGGFEIDIEVALPPEECPCVLFFVSSSTEDTVRFPFEVIGAPLAPAAHAAPAPEPTIEVVDVTIDGSGPWTSWWGGAPQRELVVVLRNNGTDAATPELDAAWGKSPDPKRILDLPALDEIGAGEERAFRLPFELDPLSVGGYTVRGSVTGPGGPVTFDVPVHTYPWGWIILLALGLQIWIVRRWRRGRADPDHDDEIDLRDGGDRGEPMVLELPAASIAELPRARRDDEEVIAIGASAGTSGTVMAASVADEEAYAIGAPTQVAVALATAAPAVAAAVIEAPPRATADLVLKHAQAILDEVEDQQMQAQRAVRVANQLAEAVIARAGVRSENLLAAAERDRTRARELLADAEANLERNRAKAEQMLADAELDAERQRHRAAQIIAAAEQRVVELDADLQRRSAALQRDPLGGAIRRAVSAAFKT